MSAPRSGGGFAAALPTPDSAGPPPGLDAFIGELSDLLDAAAVLTDPVAREAAATPWRGAVGRTPVVLRPADTAAVAEIVRSAARHGVRLVPQGANTGLVEGSVPDRYNRMAVLSTDRLDKRLEIDPADRTAVVGAGVRLSALNEALAHHGLSLPIDLGADPSIGGMVSTNTGGARMIHHGDLRRHLLGLEVVLANPPGAVLDELRPLRKDNSSPKVGDWFVGAAGRFGVVTAVALEVSPLDRDRATAFLVPADDSAAVAITVALEDSLGSRVRAIEAIGAEALQ
ncbi:MAG: FAD-binding oxidoreductase, partial [Microthrixaceae bacterium]|nr:FAD-binding oxidoreductase [Microthrixaceae bacterium]